MELTILEHCFDASCLFWHRWKTLRRQVERFYPGPGQKVGSIKDIASYQACKDCGSRRIKYSGDWRPLSAFDTKFFHVFGGDKGWLDYWVHGSVNEREEIFDKRIFEYEIED